MENIHIYIYISCFQLASFCFLFLTSLHGGFIHASTAPATPRLAPRKTCPLRSQRSHATLSTCNNSEGHWASGIRGLRKHLRQNGYGVVLRCCCCCCCRLAAAAQRTISKNDKKTHKPIFCRFLNRRPQPSRIRPALRSI